MYVWCEGVKYRDVKKAIPKLAITGNTSDLAIISKDARCKKSYISMKQCHYDSAYIIYLPPVFTLLTMDKPKCKKNYNKENGTKGRGQQK